MGRAAAKASGSGANVHVAQPVTLDVTDSSVVADNDVVDIDDGASDKSSNHSDVPPTVPWTVSEDIRAWVRGIDGGSVAQYENILLSLFDNVSQVRDLYANRLHDFFTDVQVDDA